MKGLRSALVIGGCLALLARESRGNEGQWTPDQLVELAERLKEAGLKLSPRQLWVADGDERSGGLLRAAVKLDGCTGAFVSPQGLIATNHHCAYGALQANSSVEHDYLRDGFLAGDGRAELPAKGRTVRVLRKQSDVSDQIRPGADAMSDDAARDAFIDRKRKEIVDACEAKDPQLRCSVDGFYNGSEYRLFEYLELRDLRVVYAPPASVGEYGGEIDNWMWPRHTGDFALMRAYVGADGKAADPAPSNRPYDPGQWLKVSTEGVSPGDFVAVLGYPGRTQRYLSAAEVQRNLEQILPGTVDLYGEWISILEEQAQRDPAVKIKVAALEKSLANRHKNARGMIDGLEHMKLLEARRTEDEKLKAWAGREENKKYAGVLPGLDALSEQARAHHEVDTLLSATRRGPNGLAIAIDLVRRARARQKPDLERPAGFRERDEARTWSRQERRLRDFDAEVDAQLLASILSRVAAVDAEAGAPQFGELSRIASSKGGRPKDRRAFIGRGRSLASGSAVTDAEKLGALWKEATPESLARSKDPLIAAAVSLVDLMDAAEARHAAAAGLRAKLRPAYFEMLRELRGGPIYPDANGTLRFSYASVRAYTKWDGSAQSEQTTLSEAVAKHTGAEPFDLPAKVRQGAKAAKQTYWSDPQLGDLGLCFLSDADTTGGNSGSPVIDADGRLVGFNFDRVWENIAGDFSYASGHSRNVSADVRYLLWMLDEIEDAGPLLDELGVAAVRDAPARRAAAAPSAKAASAPADAPVKPPAKAPGDVGCNCQSADPDGPAPLWALFSPLLLALRRRRRAAPFADSERPNSRPGPVSSSR